MTGAPTGLRQLTKRRQFLEAARGQRAGRDAFSLQVNKGPEPEPGLGFTVTKKVGNAPERNRIKRRLRAAAGACAQGFLPQHNYVMVGRREALGAPFASLVRDLDALLAKVHTKRPPRQPSRNAE